MDVEVSVCMITYNHEDYVKKSILGVLNQIVDFNIELIISDDCSTDNTINEIEKVINNSAKNFNINFIKRELNVGVNINFIKALEACKGKYIAICEGDDYWKDPNKLKIQYEFLKINPDFVLSFHDGYIANGLKLTNKNILNYSTKRDLNYSDLITVGYTIPTLTVLFRNVIKPGLPREMYEVTNCDSFLFIYVSQFGKIHFHKEIVDVVHVYHYGGIWSMKSKLYQSIQSYKTYKLAYKFFKDKRIYYLLNNFATSVIILAIKNNNYWLALIYYFKNLINIFIFPNILKVFLKKHVFYLGKIFRNS